MGDFTPYQKKVIGRYYDHRGEIMLTRLQEIVTELYLAGSEAKRKRLWERAETAMKALEVPPSLIEHILTKGTPEILARNLRSWLPQGRPKKP